MKHYRAQKVTKNPDGTSSFVSLIDPKYRKAEASGLTFTADGKTRTFDIKFNLAK